MYKRQFLIHKEGSKDDWKSYKSYRGITVTSTLSRLYGRVHFLEAEYNEIEAEEQDGIQSSTRNEQPQKPPCTPQ